MTQQTLADVSWAAALGYVLCLCNRSALVGSPLSQASGRSPAIRVFGVNALGTVQGQCPHGLAEGEGQRAGSRLGTLEGDSASRRHSNRAEGATWLDTLGVLLRLRKGSTPALGKEGAGPFLRTGGRGCGQEAVRLQVSAERWCEHGLPSEGRGLEGLGQRSSPPGAEVRAVVAAGAARRRLTRGHAGRFRGDRDTLCRNRVLPNQVYSFVKVNGKELRHGQYADDASTANTSG